MIFKCVFQQLYQWQEQTNMKTSAQFGIIGILCFGMMLLSIGYHQFVQAGFLTFFMVIAFDLARKAFDRDE